MRGAAFAGQIARLEERFHCIAPDLPGHGQSGGPANIATAVTRLSALLSARDLRDVTVVGWSLGAMVAWHLIAADTEGRIARMVCEDMSPHPRQTPDWSHGIRNDQPGRMSARVASDWAGTARTISHGMYAPHGNDPEMAMTQAAEMAAAQNPAHMAQFWTDLMAADARPIIAGLRVPMLVAYGAQSRVYSPSVANWLCKTAPLASKQVFRKSGHSPHLEEPDLFAQTVADFTTQT